MKTRKRILTTASVAFLLGASALSAQALDLGGISVSVGTTGSGGTQANVGVGSTNVSATIGGGTNLARADVGTYNTSLGVGVGTNTGPLLTTTSSNGSTSVDANLGGLLGVIGSLPGGGNGGGNGGGGGGGGGGGNGGGGLSPIQLAGAYGGLAPGDQMLLRNQCRSVLRNPAVFEVNLVELCRIIYQLQLRD